MPEFTEALIRNAGSLGSHDNASVVDLRQGAQLGYGAHLPEIDAATPLVMPMVYPVVVHTPTMFDKNPALKDIYPSMLKALIERHVRTIDGIDFEYRLDEQGVPVGHDGQQLMMPLASKRSEVNPSFTWNEVVGNIVWNLHYTWLRMIKDPDTQAATSALIQNGADTLDPQLISSFTMDVLFIQYDTTLRPENIIDGFFITAMWPQGTGMLGTRRSTGESTMPERNIQYRGVLQHNYNTRSAAKTVAEILQLHKVDYYTSTPVASTLKSELQNMGLHQEVNEAVSEFVQQS